MSKSRSAMPPGKRKLACADFTFPLLPHDRVLDLIAMLEFDGVDIGLFENRSHLWPSREFKNLTVSARTLKKKLEDRGLRAADVFLQLDPDIVPYAINHPERSRRRHARDAFVQTLEYARAAGSPHVTTLPGVNFPTIEPQRDSWARSQEELAWRVERAGKYGVIFGVEAHVGSLAPTCKKAQKMALGVPGLTLTLDYTHFTYAGYPDSAAEPLLQYASHLHIRGASKGRLQTRFENNKIDYARMLRVADSRNYPGFLGVEYVWTDWQKCNECDNLSETILFRDFLRSQSG